MIGAILQVLALAEHVRGDQYAQLVLRGNALALSVLRLLSGLKRQASAVGVR